MDFLSENWGNLASVLGALLTVVFSVRAERAATSAKDAANETRTKIGAIDVLADLHKVVGRIDDLKGRVESASWDSVSERSTEIRHMIAMSLAVNVISNPEVRASLSKSVSQFKAIANVSDHAAMNATSKPDISKIKKILADEKEAVLLAMVEVRKVVGGSR